VATIQEIKEDFFYLYIIELAFMIALIFNEIYLLDYIFAFRYFLIFLGIFLLEDKFYRAFLISKSKTLKDKFLLVENFKSKAKAHLTVTLVILIVSSSWGIISLLSGFWEYTIEFSSELTYILPWYIGIYVGWLVYLSHLKSQYKKLILRILRKQNIKLKIYHLILVHNSGKLIALVSLKPLGEKEQEKLKNEIIVRREDFHWNDLKVALEEEKSIKLAVVYKGMLTQKLRFKMKNILRKILIAHPAVKNGEVNVDEIYEIERVLQQELLG